MGAKPDKHAEVIPLGTATELTGTRMCFVISRSRLHSSWGCRHRETTLHTSKSTLECPASTAEQLVCQLHAHAHDSAFISVCQLRRDYKGEWPSSFLLDFCPSCTE